MERSNSRTVKVLRLYGGAQGEPHIWGDFLKDNSRKVTIRVRPTVSGICLAVGFVGTGGRNVT